jgi:hypothetical protein
MKSLLRLIFAVVLILLLGDCTKHDDSVNPAAGSFQISGVITGNGVLLAGITVSDGTRRAVTDTAGAYVIENVPNGTYTVTPAAPILAFNPTSRSVTVKGANASGVDFSASDIRRFENAKEIEIDIRNFVLHVTENGVIHDQPLTRSYRFPVKPKSDGTIDLDSPVVRNYSIQGLWLPKAAAGVRIHFAVDPATRVIQALSVVDSGSSSATGSNMVSYSEHFLLRCDNSSFRALPSSVFFPYYYVISGVTDLSKFVSEVSDTYSASIGWYRSPGMGGGYDWKYYGLTTTGHSMTDSTNITITLYW